MEGSPRRCTVAGLGGWERLRAVKGSAYHSYHPSPRLEPQGRRLLDSVFARLPGDGRCKRRQQVNTSAHDSCTRVPGSSSKAQICYDRRRE